MAFSDKVSKILYGGDYNPEQWTPDIWEQDMELLEQAGIDVVTLNVFNWASLQPSEETYDFAELDAAVKRVTEQGMAICMATSTGAHPAWMAKRYPEVLRTDFEGRRRKFGGRHNSCPNSPVFKQYAKRLAGKLAERYREQKNIVLWHVSNEYEGACYCENCEKAFRVWLKKRYGTIENLNRLWNTRFWGHTFYDWDEIVAPSMVSEHFEEARSMYQAITLDYKRFNSDSMLANYRAEAEAIRVQIPDACITTNFMGAYKPLDYKKWAASLDVVSWDNYPAEGADPAAIAMNHDLMRGLKHGQPFLLMEQTPSTCNWLNDNRLKRPGVMRLLSYQAVAHGADTVMFFQMRRSRAGCEKFHGAVIDHAGHGNTRVFKECQALGMELKALGKEVVGARVPAKAALIFDWDTWWALECSAGPSVRLKYLEELQNYYRALSKLHIPVDIIGMEDGFCGYELIAAPLLYMVKDGVSGRLEEFVRAGGTAVFSYLSGYVDENDRITLGGYPGKLRELTGIWVEETDSLPETEQNSFCYEGKTYPAGLLCDIMHTEGAEVLARYREDFYAGTPVITRNRYGDGLAYYVGTRSGGDFYLRLFTDVCKEKGLRTASHDTVETAAALSEKGIEMTVRKKDGVEYLFLLNHSGKKQELAVSVSGTDLLSGREICRGEVFAVDAAGVMLVRVLERV